MEEMEEMTRKVKEKRVLLQVPEGLKPLISKMVEVLRKAGKEVVVDLDPIFGACDVRLKEMEAVGADAVIHVGHAPMIKHPKVYYVEWKREVDLNSLEKALKKLGKQGRVCFATTTNFRWVVDKAKELGAVVGRGSWRVPYEGVVLGCDTSACEVEADANLFLGDGHFHPIAIWLNTRRPTYVLDPRGGLTRVSYEKLLKRRLTLLGSIGGKKVGIIISSKLGQNRSNLAFALKELAEERGYEANVYVSDYLDPLYILGLPEDFFVYTGCPRVPIDDWERYKKPLLTPEEFLIKLGILKTYSLGWITALPPPDIEE